MNDAISRTRQLLEAAGDPEYRFLLIEPFLSYGIAFGILLFAISFFLKHAKLQAAGLCVASVSALILMPYLSARQAALPRIDQIFRLEHNSRGKIFMENTEAWSASTWLYITVVIFAVATMIVGSRRNQLGYVLSFVTVLAGLIAIQNSLWLHYLDATAVHPNLQAHRAPIKTLDTSPYRRFSPGAGSTERVYGSPVPPANPQRREVRPIY